jgi:phage portal protein BeeE
LSFKLVPGLEANQQFFEHSVDGLLRADVEKRASYYTLALDKEKGWMDESEVRALENLSPRTPTESSRSSRLADWFAQEPSR